MPKLNCTIYACGKNIGGECNSNEVTISWMGVCDNKMVVGSDDPRSYYKELELVNKELKEEVRELERHIDNVESISGELDDLSNYVDKVRNSLDDIMANFS